MVGERVASAERRYGGERAAGRRGSSGWRDGGDRVDRLEKWIERDGG